MIDHISIVAFKFGPQYKEGCLYTVVRAVEGSEDGESGALGWSAVNGSILSHVRRLWRARILTEVCGRRGKRCKKKQERFKQEIGKNIFAMRMVSGTSCPEQCPSSEIVKP